MFISRVKGVVQKKRLETWNDPDTKYAYPRIHGLVFDPAEGLLKKLPVDFRGEIGKYQHIYDLYDFDKDKGEGDEESHYMFKKPLDSEKKS
jgi:hypothetical protein